MHPYLSRCLSGIKFQKEHPDKHWNIHSENRVFIVMYIFKLPVNSGRDHCPCITQFHPLSCAIASAGPAGIDQPYIYFMLP